MKPVIWIAALLTVGLTACDGHMPMHGHGGKHAAPGQVNLQGNDQAAFMANPNVRAYYDLTVKTFAGGTDKVNFPVYQEQSYALFRAMGTSMGVGPAAMQDHLKDIPAQMLKIVKDDPTVLKDFDTFKAALVGPA